MDEGRIDPLEENSNFTTLETFTVDTVDSTAQNINCSLFLKTGDDPCFKYNLVFNVGISGTLSVAGLIGNILSVMVLSYERRQNAVAVILLQWLAAFDSILLFVLLIINIVSSVLVPPIVSPYFHAMLVAHLAVYLQPLGYMAQTGTLLLTLLLAFNRYIVICYPFQSYKFCSLNRVRLQIGAVTLFSVVINMPRFFQLYVVHDGISYCSEETSIGANSSFGVIYTNVIYLVLVLLFPLIVLTVLNFLLTKELRALRKRRNNIGGSGGSSDDENNLTLVMVVIVLILLICQVPDRVYVLLKMAHPKLLACGQPLHYFNGVCNLLVTFNSASNFVLYCFLRPRFRRLLKIKVCGKKTKHTYSTDTDCVHIEQIQNADNRMNRKSLITLINKSKKNNVH